MPESAVHRCTETTTAVVSEVTHLSSSFRHRLPPGPQLPLQQGLGAVAAPVPPQSFELLQVLPLLHGQTFWSGEQAAPCHKDRNRCC